MTLPEIKKAIEKLSEYDCLDLSIFVLKLRERTQRRLLAEREKEARKAPEKLKPLGTAVRKLRRSASKKAS
jgi:hypothetical protein